VIRRAAVPLLLLLGATAAPLPAQDGSILDRLSLAPAAADSVTPQAEPSPPAPIPLERIPRRLETDFERIQRATEILARDTAAVSDGRGLEETLDAIDAILDNLDSLAVERLPVTTLRDYHEALEREQRRVEGAGDELAIRFADLDEMRRELLRASEEWRLTREALATDTLAAGRVLDGIAELSRSLDSLRDRLRKRIGDLLERGEELARAEGRLDEAITRVVRAQASVRRRLLVQDAPPLWDLGALTAAGSPLLGDVVAYATRDARAFWQSVDAGRHRLALHLLILLGTLLVLLTLRVRVREWPEETGTEAARFVLGRPLAASFLVALIAARWVYPHASMLVFDAAFLLSAIAVLRLIPAGAPPALRRGIYLLVPLAAFTRAAAALLPPPGLARRVAFLLAAVAALLLLLAIREKFSERARAGRRGSLESFARAATTVALGLAGASAILNVAGWADLAALLIVGTVSSAYLAVVLGIGAMVVESGVRAALSGPIARRSTALLAAREGITRVSVGAIRLSTALLWLQASLAAFGLDRALLSWLRTVLTRELAIGAVSLSLGRILLFGIVIWLAVRIGKLVKRLLRDDVFPRFEMSPGRADAYATLAHWAILLAGILFAAASAGLGGGQLAVVAGALSVGIGFGLQNIVNNFVSGFILIFEQPIKAGDKIEIRGINLLGEVKRIGIRSSTIRTFDGADVIVPNSNVIQSEVVNWTLSDPTRRVQLDVGVAYGTPPEEVIRLLEKVAKSEPGVLPNPEPFALFTGFGESSLDFRLMAWSATFEESIRLKSQLAVATEKALREAGFEIPFPQRDLHIRSVDGRAAGALRTPQERDSGTPDSA
jgi:small-conductance mechanosensitive channel